MDPAAAAQCALHPESPAVGTCARCGRFACVACLAADGLCTACAQRASDPYGLSRAFTHFESVRIALRLLWAELPRVLLVAMLFSVPVGLLQAALPDVGDISSLSRSVRASALYDWLIGTIGAQTMLALFIARGEGRVLTLGQAFNESMMNWNRAIAAGFRSGLWTALFTLLLIIPGVWQSVMLMFSRIAALRTKGDALEASRAIVRGRFWACFGFGLIYVAVLLVAMGLSVAFSLVLESLHAPVVLNEFVSDVITRIASDVIGSALLYAGFVTLNVTAGTPLEPMHWRRELPLRQPSHS